MPSNSFTVLVVDDTSTNLLILKKTLQSAGYQVVTAENGEEGRSLAGRHMPDLILLDIMMPGEDGFETIVKLKANPQTVSIPVIFLTALSDVDAKVKGFGLGAVDFITKPFHPAEIRARVSLQIKLNIATNALIQSQAERLRQIGAAQHAMLVSPEDMPDAKFQVEYTALHEAGGDFYDVINVSENVFGYFVADVSGHDIATSFVTASVKALLRQNCSPVYSPAESMRIINRVLLGVMPDGKYLTASYVAIDRKAMRGTVVSMGHPPIVHQPLNGKATLLSYDGDILGVFPDGLYSEHEVKLAKGDRLFIYSDGLIEGTGAKHKVWAGETSTLACFIQVLGQRPLNECLSAMKERFHPGGAGQDDDIVIMAVEV